MASTLSFDSSLYIRPGAVQRVEFDFQDDIPSGDSIKTALTAGGTGTKVEAFDETFTPVLGLVSDVIVIGTKLRATIKNAEDQTDYLVIYTIQTATSGETFDKVLVVFGRRPQLVQ